CFLIAFSVMGVTSLSICGSYFSSCGIELQWVKRYRLCARPLAAAANSYKMIAVHPDRGRSGRSAVRFTVMLTAGSSVFPFDGV
ncbi:MAG: hypothetical protein II420_01255, partial [Oscillospiraceae bacterium]|nr:hypothetical protein [Oscillospiraceae bacterium]